MGRRYHFKRAAGGAFGGRERDGGGYGSGVPRGLHKVEGVVIRSDHGINEASLSRTKSGANDPVIGRLVLVSSIGKEFFTSDRVERLKADARDHFGKSILEMTESDIGRLINGWY
jgi:hypothetical protein